MASNESRQVPRKKNRQAKLTQPASKGWDLLCRRHRVTFTTLIEALGEHAHAHDWVPSAVIARAQALDDERRSRDLEPGERQPGLGP